jgi:hypothetical protein
MNMEYSEAGPPAISKLNPDFYQSLWYGSDQNIISKDLIKEQLGKFFRKEAPAVRVVGERKIEGGKRKQILIDSKPHLLTSIIMGKIDTVRLNQLHKMIKEAKFAETREILSNKQIDLIVAAINEALNSGNMTEEYIAIVRQLLS